MSIAPRAPYGSLLKTGVPRSRRLKAPKPSTRVNDRDYLALIRRCPCLSCDNDPAGVAAHVRMTRAGKPITGAGIKPGDQWTLPLCAACHTDGPGAQHVVGEVRFWADLGLDPLVICQRLHAASPKLDAMRLICFAERERRK